jgi:putative tryptophan/tyrosine transport system substrate-binding protein
VPIVFTAAVDPVGAGYVASLSRPGGNATGFSVYEYAVGAKWLELLKQIAPSVKRALPVRLCNFEHNPAKHPRASRCSKTV